MENNYFNNLGSERSVEVIFVEYALRKYYKNNDVILDIGGVPTTDMHLNHFKQYISDNNIDYRISDFRGGHYQGDFVEYNFTETFDIGIFLSSLEHFPKCTESDSIWREGYDRKGYEKSLQILNPNGYIFLTVPFGKHRWQPNGFHQNYNWQGILDLTKGSTIVESHTYALSEDENEWVKTHPNLMEEILYTNRAGGVGCFILQKN